MKRRMKYLGLAGINRWFTFVRVWFCVIGISVFLPTPITSMVEAEEFGETESGSFDLTELSLSQLVMVKVVSASKKAEKLSETAAAAYVITQDDIRRSGATSIPEALRMVPGLQVARIDSNKAAISSRGFNGRFANKLLVLLKTSHKS